MKKILILTMVLTTLFFISCSNNDDEPIQNKKQWTAQPVLKLLSSTRIYDKPSEQKQNLERVVFFIPLTMIILFIRFLRN